MEEEKFNITKKSPLLIVGGIIFICLGMFMFLFLSFCIYLERVGNPLETTSMITKERNTNLVIIDEKEDITNNQVTNYIYITNGYNPTYKCIFSIAFKSNKRKFFKDPKHCNFDDFSGDTLMEVSFLFDLDRIKTNIQQ